MFISPGIIIITCPVHACDIPLCFKSVILKLGSIEPPRFDGAVSGVRRRSSEFSNPLLLYGVLGKNGVRQKL